MSQTDDTLVRVRFLEDCLDSLAMFRGPALAQTISRLEYDLVGRDVPAASQAITNVGITTTLLESAFHIKAASAQINVIIHAAGILYALPRLLDDNEKIESMSLGAGNTGKAFDLETDRRVAEFKFIKWRGGPESIRQNNLFKDYFELLVNQTPKRKVLYVLGTEIPLQFFRSRRALTSVLSKNASVAAEFATRFGTRYKTVNEFYADHVEQVEIQDLCVLVPEFKALVNVLP